MGDNSMSRATSYTLNDRMELAGPTLEEQCAEAVSRMEQYGIKVERVTESFNDAEIKEWFEGMT